jgi:hypothetical protein
LRSLRKRCDGNGEVEEREGEKGGNASSPSCLTLNAPLLDAREDNNDEEDEDDTKEQEADCP